MRGRAGAGPPDARWALTEGITALLDLGTQNEAAKSAASGSSARIRIEGLGRHYGSFEVFRDINLEVGDAEIVAIVGPSGCGKTTLFRCIDGLIPLSRGEIKVEGERVTAAAADGVAMVFQHFGLFPWKTVYANVGLWARLARASRAEIEPNGCRSSSSWSGWPVSSTLIPISSPAACNSVRACPRARRSSRACC